jgi:hypothetical protein
MRGQSATSAEAIPHAHRRPAHPVLRRNPARGRALAPVTAGLRSHQAENRDGPGAAGRAPFTATPPTLWQARVLSMMVPKPLTRFRCGRGDADRKRPHQRPRPAAPHRRASAHHTGRGAQRVHRPGPRARVRPAGPGDPLFRDPAQTTPSLPAPPPAAAPGAPSPTRPAGRLGAPSREPERAPRARSARNGRAKLPQSRPVSLSFPQPKITRRPLM